jgi:hypothetical protein
MIEAWEATWMGERVYLELNTAGVFESFAKAAFWGLLGRPKARSILLYGNQVVERREIDEPLQGGEFEFSLMGKAKQPDGQDAHFHARYTYKMSSQCELQINGTPVPMQMVSP